MNRLSMHDLGSHTSWEELRRQACHLENEIDIKLVQFSKLGTSYSSLRSYSSAHNGDRSSTVQLAENMAKDLQQLIAQLTKVNERMAAHVNSTSVGGVSSGTLQHTLQRHWDIVQDYEQEFNKIHSNISAFRDREELLRSVDHDVRIGMPADIYLKEHDHLLSSERLIDEQIGLAAATKENMLSQKSALYGVTGKMNTLTNRFPAINNLIQRINFHKRRDAIIIGSLIAVCLIFLLWYSLH